MTVAEIFSESFSARLKTLRNSQSKADFAKSLGLKAPTYFRYEAGRLPKLEMLRHISSKCGVTVDWLLGRTEERLPPVPRSPAQMLKDSHKGVGWTERDRDRYVQQAKDKGEETTLRFAEAIARRLTALRVVPPSYHAKVRADIDGWLDRYQQWCAANHPNEAALSAELARRGEPKRESAPESEHARGKSTIGETDNLSETEPSQQ